MSSQDRLRPKSAASRMSFSLFRGGSLRRSSPVLTIMVLGFGVLQPMEGQAIELAGAWATQTDLCKLVFTKQGNQVTFAELSDLYGSGFIIDGSRISGKTAKCTIKSRKQEGDSLELSAACATRIMTSDIRFSLKVVDDNTLFRLLPEVPGMDIKYYRCEI
jgi:hypothetical protein